MFLFLLEANFLMSYNTIVIFNIHIVLLNWILVIPRLVYNNVSIIFNFTELDTMLLHL